MCGRAEHSHNLFVRISSFDDFVHEFGQEGRHAAVAIALQGARKVTNMHIMRFDVDSTVSRQ